MPYADKDRQKYESSRLSREAKERLRTAVDDIKSAKSCFFCSESDPVALDFHHIDPHGKRLGVSRMVNRRYNIDKIMKEIDGCIVLCANCHRKVHSGKLTV